MPPQKKWFKWFDLKYLKIEHKMLLTYPLLILLSIAVVSSFAVYFSMQHLEERATTYTESILKQISHNLTINFQVSIKTRMSSFIIATLVPSSMPNFRNIRKIIIKCVQEYSIS